MKPWWLANAIGLTSRNGGRSGSSIRVGSRRSAWSSSTRPGPRPTWRRCADGRGEAKRLTAKVAHRRWKTTTVLAALRHDRIEAPWLIDGPIDGASFRTYVEMADGGADVVVGAPPRRNAPTTSKTQDTRQPEFIPL